VIFYVLNADSSQYADALISRTAPVIGTQLQTRDYLTYLSHSAPDEGGSVAEWLACWTQAQGNSLRQTIHTHRASVHQAAKLAAALLRVARVTAGLAESNDCLPPGL